MGCGCGGNSSGQRVSVIDHGDYDSLVQSLGLSAPTPLAAVTVDGNTYDTQKFFLLGNKMALAVGTKDGEKGCATIPMAGIPVRMCWNIQGSLNIPKADLTIELTFSLGGVLYYAVKYKVECTNLPDLSSCRTELISETAAADKFAVKGCNWGCLALCAPSCLYCGKNYWCWAACAASCVSSCC